MAAVARARRRRAPASRLLLDTHALLWWLTGDRQLSATAQRVIGEETNDIYVSAASAWEISTRLRLGKLHDPEGVTRALRRHLAAQGFLELPILLEHAQEAGALPGPHRDPFDRMLIAQARLEELALVSNEEPFDRYGITRVW